MMPEPDIDLPVTLPWPTICALACLARIENRSLNDLVLDALARRLDRTPA